MTNQVNEVLEKIREVCGIQNGFTVPITKSGETVSRNHPKARPIEPQLNHLLWALNMPGDTRYESVILKGNKLRIITPTNETETSIEDGVGINNEQYGTVVNDVWADVEIDLTLSVEDNLLSNPSLTKWVHGVIIGKE